MIILLEVYGTYIAFFVVAFGLSTLIIQKVILKSDAIESKKYEEIKKRKGEAKKHQKEDRDQAKSKIFGVWIGFFEALIVFILAINGAFDAMAIIFVAKIYSRRKEIKKAPVYYLLGALTNLCITIIFALVAKDFINLFNLR